MMTSSVPVDHRPPAADDMDPGSDDSDHDHPLQEPEFVIHAVDDHLPPWARRAPAPRALPIQQHPPPPPLDPAAAADREAARIDRLRGFMLFPQGVCCGSILVFGSMMIYYAVHPEMWPDLTWVIVFTALIMLLAVVSLVLSHLGVYVYDRCPGLNEWLP